MLKLRVFTLSGVLLILIGCEIVKTEYSPELSESAKVVDVIFSPSRHGSGVGPTIDLTGSGGIGLAFTSVDVPEKYAVVFECSHGKFVIQGDQEKAKKLWEKLKRDQQVIVKYKEVYESLYDDDKLLKRSLIKYDFIDAQ